MSRVLIAAAVAIIAFAACSAEEATYDTYTDDDGNVWIVSDCPNTDQALSGNPDGLPYKGETTNREKIEAWLGDGGTVVPRNGEVWERASDGSVVVTRVEDYMIEVTVEDVGECPSMPAVNNGVPVVYRIADTAETPSDATKPTLTSGVEMCLPNVPNPPGFVPPKGYPSKPSIEGWLWYGTEDLWTALPFGEPRLDPPIAGLRRIILVWRPPVGRLVAAIQTRIGAVPEPIRRCLTGSRLAR